MTCEVVREQLIETARGRELSSDLRAIVFGHAARCPECAERLELQQRLSAVFSEIALRADAAPKRVEEALLRQLPVPMLRKKRVAIWEWTAAGIAAALVSGFIWMQHSAAPASQPALAHQAVSAREELASDFVALPFAEETSADEQTSVVQVSLSGESLLAMGIPVSSDLMGQQVLADIEIGMDGTARAIRLAN